LAWPGAAIEVRPATPAKLAQTPSRRFDAGDPAPDAALISRRFFSVIVGYHYPCLVKASDQPEPWPQ